ncbi:dystrobrevin binding protein 1b isoform X1 [Clupea harengus]|uniref:Dystrobrevin binding protein 1b isoform X1 n=1 Tax=Clupea harengus TaxID=7950 RepID=A0A6P8GUN9_CLUHA|nr:dystrobrevin binding protein 1b isoform X1 [Clupea harengus]
MSTPGSRDSGMSTPGSRDSSKRNSSELDSDHAQKVQEMEHQHQHQVKLKDRQKFFEEAYQQDVEQYLSTGYLQINERRGPIGSMSSMEVNVDMLEQMDLMDVSDHEPLDVFINSGGEDNSVASPMLDPDVESFTTELTLQVPTQAELRHKLSSLSSTCTDSASQEDEDDEEEEEEEEEPQGAACLSSARAALRGARGRGGNRNVAVASTGSSSASQMVKNGEGNGTQAT